MCLCILRVLYKNGEYRRSLALLEHRNFLSAENISILSDLIRPNDTTDTTTTATSNTPPASSTLPSNLSTNKPTRKLTMTTNTTTNLSNSITKLSLDVDIVTSLTAICIASQCLLGLGQYEDCLLLLEHLIYSTTEEVQGQVMKWVVGKSRAVYAASAVGVDSNSINIVSGMRVYTLY